MTAQIVGAHQRAQRLVQLYTLRGQIDDEIHTIEAQMANETEFVKKARDEAKTKARVASCGTDAGYYRHIRRVKEQACPACLAAHAHATKRRGKKKGQNPSPIRALSVVEEVESESQSGPESAGTDRGLRPLPTKAE